MELALSVGGSDLNRQRYIYMGTGDEDEKGGSRSCIPVQLDLKLSWPNYTGDCSYYEGSRSSDKMAVISRGGFDVNEIPSAHDVGPSDVGKRDCETDVERGSWRCSDEEEGGSSTRKKLRLSKEQSCYLEESFKEHPTLNPKQKLALARQLNLRPRQVEVWFQNRRARTKLKQTEVDCEYLKRCCDSLTEENRKLHRELQDLKALKSSNSPFHVHAPATTLTMCPSCERLSTSSSDNSSKTTIFGVPKSRFYPFSKRTSAAS